MTQKMESYWATAHPLELIGLDRIEDWIVTLAAARNYCSMTCLTGLFRHWHSDVYQFHLCDRESTPRLGGHALHITHNPQNCVWPWGTEREIWKIQTNAHKSDLSACCLCCWFSLNTVYGVYLCVCKLHHLKSLLIADIIYFVIVCLFFQSHKVPTQATISCSVWVANTWHNSDVTKPKRVS